MTEQRKPRALATKTASKVPKMVRANLAATLSAKQEGKKVAYAYIQDAHDEAAGDKGGNDGYKNMRYFFQDQFAGSGIFFTYLFMEICAVSYCGGVYHIL